MLSHTHSGPGADGRWACDSSLPSWEYYNYWEPQINEPDSDFKYKKPCYSESHPGAVRVTVRESSVEVVRGESAPLPCSFFTLMPLFRLSIIWTLTPLSDPDSPTQVKLDLWVCVMSWGICTDGLSWLCFIGCLHSVLIGVHALCKVHNTAFGIQDKLSRWRQEVWDYW